MTNERVNSCEKDKTEMSNFFVYVPYLMCIYTCELQRGKGKQAEIFKKIIELSEATGEIFYTVADAFVLKKRKIDHDVRSPMVSFYEDGHKRPYDWCNLTRKQKNRFKSYGLQNFVLPSAEATEPWQHWIYIPSTASNDHKMIIRTLLHDSPMPIECEKQLSKAG